MTELSETDPSQIYTELAAATSPKTAEILMHETLDVSWEDIANKADVTATKNDLVSEIAEFRAETRVGFADMNANLERQLRIRSSRTLALMSALFSLLGGLVLAVN
jgi:hypothetical protein